ncbi:methylamine utilization protein-like protein [Aeromonas diversa CDC 2478-85]|uniref:Methylamine utilization protein MauE n=1 Tax=Aeromonas diversa CDC 2478-85 TaxID=1268237 RepID=N9VMR9_9GAMM|nr:MauE/DoxX family redox-associated membrane protein [Aeromonas diversa]ENY72646.1 methylamine utilization protein-like protein [Aeromonas diversa CDC 2478-85]
MAWRLPARLLLGGFFLLSAIFKTLSPALFVQQIDAFGLVWSSLQPAVAWGVIALEALAGGAVIMGRRWGVWLMIALLLMFIAVLGYGVAIGLDIACGCLGKADLGSLPQAIGRDLLMLAMAAALLFPSRPFSLPTKEVS